ncbi:MAG: MarP family serine protease [Actinomycetales bacterium]|nr:MarP family serine protease [Actinomycetales bacterium]
MIAANILDLLLGLVLLVLAGEGFRDGLGRSLTTILGMAAGAVAGVLLIPLVAAWIPAPLLRTIAVIAVAIGLLVAGHAVGSAIGGLLRRDEDERPLGLLGRIAGAALNLVAASLVVALVAGGVGALGIPVLSQATAQSRLLGIIDAITPAPLDQALARVRGTILEEGLPALGGSPGGVATSPGAPDVPTDTDPWQRAGASVVRITGTAYACGQNQSGTGFAVAPERILTNAHVVAGVEAPVVEAPNGQALEARVVAFDPQRDLALLAVPGLELAPLAVDEGLEVGDTGAVEGYPYGGPFSSSAARVLAISNERIPDVGGGGSSRREIYTLAADIAPGNSGGPLLAADGEVAGVVFARGAEDPSLGYALTPVEFAGLVDSAAGLQAAVSSGSCTPG